MDSFWAGLVVKTTLPLATWWVGGQEKRVLEKGRELSDWECEWARHAGVTEPEKIRVLSVPVVPTPGGRILNPIKQLFGIGTEAPTGMAVGYGIFLESGQHANPSLLVHEMAHVAQYERFGGIRGFLHEYLHQCLNHGYWEAELEHEAREAAAMFTRPPGG